MHNEEGLLTDIHESIEKHIEEIIDLSREIYNFAELGSMEFRSSSAIIEKLRNNGFNVQENFMDMKTAFRAEYGSGCPTVGLLMEYDALPNGHSCGHNLISAWAYGTAVVMKDLMDSGKIVLFGTPSEEGIGPYAGSKIIMANKGCFSGIDFMLGMHPDDRWCVGCKALADLQLEFTFKGKSAHMAASPWEGINALDALVTSYAAINNSRDWAGVDKHLVLGMIIKDGGRSSNVIPDRAVLEVDIRSTSSEFLNLFKERIVNLVASISRGFGTELEVNDLIPMYTEYSANTVIDQMLQEDLEKMGVKVINLDRSTEIASGSTDEANVSLKVPTGHIDMKVGDNLPGHSDLFRIASEPEKNIENLKKAILATANSALKIIKEPAILDKIKREFGDVNGKN
ncbi:M20 family metallopeptidase [Oxyplasma meridianum]|uniref:Peptidase M20 domain-containing protein 2 n=1 Tax=Oxyplasma meridianum TaxID=3073602 RepID=A0AAX4NIZ9_9ARCH